MGAVTIPRARSKARRYVVLRHEGMGRPHFDLLIESRPGGKLESWRVYSWPMNSRSRATHRPPHRRLYLDYEGPLTDGRGCVWRHESGNCIVKVAEDGKWIVDAVSDSGRIFSLKLRLDEPS